MRNLNVAELLHGKYTETVGYTCRPWADSMATKTMEIRSRRRQTKLEKSEEMYERQLRRATQIEQQLKKRQQTDKAVRMIQKFYRGWGDEARLVEMSNAVEPLLERMAMASFTAVGIARAAADWAAAASRRAQEAIGSSDKSQAMRRKTAQASAAMTSREQVRAHVEAMKQRRETKRALMKTRAMLAAASSAANAAATNANEVASIALAAAYSQAAAATGASAAAVAKYAAVGAKDEADELAFYIGLLENDGMTVGFRKVFTIHLNVTQSLSAVDLRLACS